MFKLYWQISKKGKILAIFTVILCLFQIFFNLGQTYVMQICFKTIEHGFDKIIWYKFWLFTGLLFAFATLTIIFGIIVAIMGTKVSLMWAKEIRHKMFAKICTYSLKDYNKITNASILTRFTNDTQKLQMQLMMFLTMFIQAPLTLIAGLAMTFIANWYIGLGGVGALAITIVGMAFFARYTVPVINEVQQCIDKTNLILRENVLGSRVIKSFCLEEKQQERFNVINEHYRKANTKIWLLYSLMFTIFLSILNISTFIVFTIGGTVMLHNPKAITGITIYYLANLLTQILQSIISAVMVAVQIIRAIPSYKRINLIFSITPDIQQSQKKLKINEKNMDIVFNKVNFKFYEEAKKNILDNISFTIKQGQSIGIIGESGAGKTTLINLLNRSVDPTKGKITIGGIDLKDLDLFEIKKHIRTVAQDPFMFFGTVKYNLMFGDQNATNKDLDKATKMACAYDFLQKNSDGYEHSVEQRGRNFSGGQRQRLCIARTLLSKPSILVLDDSTSALDMATEAKLQSNIRKNFKNTTVIVVAQRVSSVRNLDNILVLDHGKISAFGNHNYLKKNNPIYRSIIVSQMGQAGLK